MGVVKPVFTQLRVLFRAWLPVRSRLWSRLWLQLFQRLRSRLRLWLRMCPRARPGPSARARSGQMTIEMAVALPVLIVVAVIAVNAMTFFSECAVFDRVAHETVRVHAASPAFGQGFDQTCALIEQTLESQLDVSNIDVSVSHGITGVDFDEYTATLEFSPTLFGMGLRSQVLGVSLPRLVHTTRYVVDGYRAGVIV